MTFFIAICTGWCIGTAFVHGLEYAIDRPHSVIYGSLTMGAALVAFLSLVFKVVLVFVH